jgi:PEP-CTERM motif
MKHARLAAALAALALCGAARADGVPGQGIWETSLQARDLDGNAVNGPEAFYDTVLDITWLRNADVNGLMTWDTAVTWVAGLDINGVQGWRLPTMIDTGPPGCDGSDGISDCGWNVRTKSGNPALYEAGQAVYSEMAHLFYVTLGNKAQAGDALANSGNFQNLQGGRPYWSGLEFAPDPSLAWVFINGYADQRAEPKGNDYFAAMAVRTGDVTAVPEPETGAIMLVGLGTMILAVRRRPV